MAEKKHRPYDHERPEFWDAAALDQELRRVTQICHGCRLCYNLCPSFPFLFARIDAIDREQEKRQGIEPPPPPAEEHAPEGQHATAEVKVSTMDPVAELTPRDFERAVDLCFNCKLCYVKCPYTPPHEFMLDFPRLMLRSKAVKAKREGVKMQDRVLGNPDLFGKMATTTAGLANWAQHTKFNRALMEKVLGVHRDRQLPEWASETFTAWWRKRTGKTGDPYRFREGGPASGRDIGDVSPVFPDRVVLFYTCSVEYNRPETGRAAVEVLERNGVEVVVPEGLRCCGMPFLDSGDLSGAVESIRRSVDALLPHARAGLTIVSPGPTCSFMMKQEWAELDTRPEAREVARAVMDLGEYLMKRKDEGKLALPAASPHKKIAYHLPCHLKAQNIGYRSRDLLRAMPGARVGLVEQCCGMDGTWGMKKEFYELSLGVAKKAVAEVKDADPEVVATDCPLAAIQLAQTTGKPVRHPIELLAEAYRSS